MAGNDEGINAWMTVNFLLGSLGGTGKSDLLILGPLFRLYRTTSGLYWDQLCRPLGDQIQCLSGVD